MVRPGKLPAVQPGEAGCAATLAAVTADAAFARELQLTHDLEMAAELQAELDGELAHEVHTQLQRELADLSRVDALRARLARGAGKEVAHLGKATLRNIRTTLKTGGETLGDVLRACKSSDAQFERVLELVDAGQRARVREELAVLLRDDELTRAL
jgi:predicted RNase H-like nuclease (RuvC/YqgF family)